MILEKAKTSELVEFYNKNVPADKQIKKFRDRATAEKRCRALITPVLKTEKPVLKTGVGAFISRGILNGWTAERIVSELRSSYPKSKSTEKDVAWWRFKLRKEGHEIPLSHYKRPKQCKK
jgi:hypothetical protein